MNEIKFNERLKEALNIRNMKQIELSEKTGIHRGTINNYILGKYEPKQDKIYVISKVLDVNPSWLLGYNVPMTRNDNKDISYFGNVIPITKKRIPILGEIACCKPIYANEEKELYIDVGTDLQADFCLKCRGDSMIGARINDGDIVFIKNQSSVENGNIAAVVINDEATLKRVYYYPNNSKLVLQAENPKYEPLVYVGEELNTIIILGKAIAFQSDIK